MREGGTAEVFRELAPEPSGHRELRLLPLAETDAGVVLSAGFDAMGRHVLYVEPPQSHSTGILWRSTGLLVEGHSSPAIIVRHEGRRGAEQFALLCNDISDALTTSSQEDTENVLLRTIRDWASLFGESRAQLDRQAILGLLGELVTLNKLRSELGDRPALEAWTGPDRMRHDFVGTVGALEVKSISIEEGLRAQFHGLRQLALPVDGGLHLHLHQFEATPQGGMTLSSVIASLPEIIRHDEKLLQAVSMTGCDPDDLRAADTCRYHLRDSRVLAVDGRFPRLTPDALRHQEWADSILGVSYTVDLSGIPPVDVSPAAALEGDG